MTGMLASVRDAREAAMVLDAGADVIDLKEPARGALGGLDEAVIGAIVEQVNGRTRVSATIGDLPFRKDAIGPPLESVAATGVDIIKIGVFDDPADPGVLQMLRDLSAGGLRIVLVLFAEDPFHEASPGLFAEHGICGVMLDTREKGNGSLREKMTDRRIGAFVSRARENGLLCGLAGSLRLQDIPALLAMQPDYLGFRGALCNEGNRTGGLDPAIVGTIRRALSDPVMEGG